MSQIYTKEVEQKRGTKLFHLISTNDWQIHNIIYAFRMAQGEANKLKPSRMQGSPAGCLYETRAIIYDAYFELTNGGGFGNNGAHSWGLPPRSQRQCFNVNTPDLPCLEEGAGALPSEPTTTYTPGGKTPPCPGGIEGCCQLVLRKTQWLTGSTWAAKYLRSSGVRLIFKYRVWATNLVGRPISSNATCVLPQPFPLRSHTVTWPGSIGINQRSRPYSFYERYTCKCNCEKIEYPQPCSEYEPPNIGDQLLALLAAGKCLEALNRAKPILEAAKRACGAGLSIWMIGIQGCIDSTNPPEA